MTRLLPVYYATFIFGLPLISAGHSYFGPYDWHHNVGGAFLAFFGVQTWVLAYGFGPNGECSKDLADEYSCDTTLG